MHGVDLDLHLNIMEAEKWLRLIYDLEENIVPLATFVFSEPCRSDTRIISTAHSKYHGHFAITCDAAKQIFSAITGKEDVAKILAVEPSQIKWDDKPHQYVFVLGRGGKAGELFDTFEGIQTILSEALLEGRNYWLQIRGMKNRYLIYDFVACRRICSNSVNHVTFQQIKREPWKSRSIAMKLRTACLTLL